METLHEYTRRYRLKAVRVYLETQSARSQFHEMMADATREYPMFRKILVHDISRLSRWLGGLGALRDRLEANGVTVVSVTEAAGESTTGQSTPSRAGLVEG